MIRTIANNLPYITTAAELAAITAQMAAELLWRKCGYDERKPTPEDVQAVLAGLDQARETFLADVAPNVVIDGRPHLHLVQDVG